MTEQGEDVADKSFTGSWGFARLTAVIVVAGALGGCGLSTLTSGIGSSVLGGGSGQSQGGSLSAQKMLDAAKADGNSTSSITTAAGDVSYGCPRVSVLPREHQLTIYEDGRMGDPLWVMHRGELTKTARECQVGPGQVTVKYGFSGVIRLGPKGRTGSVVLPVLVHVADSQRNRVRTERMNVQASVVIDNPIGYFSHVQTITFDVPPGARPGEFELQVGFENADQPAG
ncbi:MAG: hypothetical protein RLZ98_3256 [Pseudomonadota bacterium]|jgi:hypothetical protein